MDHGALRAAPPDETAMAEDRMVAAETLEICGFPSGMNVAASECIRQRKRSEERVRRRRRCCISSRPAGERYDGHTTHRRLGPLERVVHRDHPRASSVRTDDATVGALTLAQRFEWHRNAVAQRLKDGAGVLPAARLPAINPRSREPGCRPTAPMESPRRRGSQDVAPMSSVAICDQRVS